MAQTGRQSANTSNVLSVIMGGGQGTRLFPLTKERAKPAVPLAGKYRLVDIPISNCINSGLRRVYLLTQFNSASLTAIFRSPTSSTISPGVSSKSSPPNNPSRTPPGIKARPTPSART